MLYACGRGIPRPDALKVRVGSLVSNMNCAVSCKVFHLLLLCGMKPQTSPMGGRGEVQGRQVGRLPQESIKHTCLLTIGY